MNRGNAAITIEPLGDRALIAAIEGGDMTPVEGAERLEAEQLPWLTDAVPAYDSLTVVWEPRALARWIHTGGYARWREGRSGSRIDRLPSFDAAGADSREGERPSLPYAAAAAVVRWLLADAIEAQADRAGDAGNAKRIVDIPVVYGGEYGPDLAECAARAGMSEAAFASAHASGAYTVAMIGFLPGFPYLAGLPVALAQPRKAQPRPHVPAGSVGIAGMQTGIYSFGSPGGWQIIGRTPIALFDPDAADRPTLLRAGDQVRFVPVATADAAAASESAWTGPTSRTAAETKGGV